MSATTCAASKRSASYASSDAPHAAAPIEHHYAAVGNHDPERVVAQLAGRFFTTPETKLSVRALLDATAIAELHVDLDRLFRRARELESQTVARAGLAGGRTFPVHVVCVVDASADYCMRLFRRARMEYLPPPLPQPLVVAMSQPFCSLICLANDCKSRTSHPQSSQTSMVM